VFYNIEKKELGIFVLVVMKTNKKKGARGRPALVGVRDIDLRAFFKAFINF
jgi:hypothetical protein